MDRVIFFTVQGILAAVPLAFIFPGLCFIKVLRYLKVVGNEKLGGLKFLQLLGIGLGPWRLISIFILNMPFPNTKRMSVSGLSSNMNRR